MKHKLLLFSVVALFACAPMIDSGNEWIASAGLVLGLFAIAGMFVTACRAI